MIEPTSSPLAVQTIRSDGTAPERRMSTPAAAWSSYITIRNQNQKRDARFATMEGMYAGFPPTPPQVMIDNGMPDMPNINTKQFQAKIATYVSTWHAVTASGPRQVEVKAKHPDPQEAMRRSEAITEAFNWAIQEWDYRSDDEAEFCPSRDYVINSSFRDTQMGIFGIGFSMFEDDIDFRWRGIPTRRILLPQRTRLSLDNCPVMFIEDEISVAQLWQRRKQTGWNEAAITRALYDRVELNAPNLNRNWTYGEWVNWARNNDTPYNYDFAPVRIVHAFTMEFNNTISHSVFCDFTYTSNTAKKDIEGSKKQKEYGDAAQQFLYDKPKVARKWSQIGVAFSDNAGPEGEWHGVKGFGDLIFDGCDLSNLLFNRAATGAFISNTLMFKGLTESDVQKLNQITLTQMGIMAPGLELEQQKFAGDIQGAMAVFAANTNVIDSNTRIFPQNQKNNAGEQPTATQVNFDRADQAQFQNLQVLTYQTCQDVLFAEMYRRIAQPASKYPKEWGGGGTAAEFRRRCAEAGIPENELLNVVSVRANRNGGSGNMALDIMKADQLMAVATPGMGQLNARKMKAAAVIGWQNVDSIVESAPQPQPDDQSIDQDNLFIQEGQVPAAFGWQDQEKHLLSHFQLLTQSSEVAQGLLENQGVEQNIEAAEKLSNLLLAGAQHCAMHLQLMQEVPPVNGKPSLHEAMIKEGAKVVNNVAELGQSLAEEVAKVKQAQQPQMSPEMMKAQNQIQIDNAKAEAEIQRKNFAAQQKLGTQAMTAEARTQMKLSDHDQKLLMEQQKFAQQQVLTAAAARQQRTEQAAKTVQELIANNAKNAQAQSAQSATE